MVLFLNIDAYWENDVVYYAMSALLFFNIVVMIASTTILESMHKVEDCKARIFYVLLLLLFGTLLALPLLVCSTAKVWLFYFNNPRTNSKDYFRASKTDAFLYEALFRMAVSLVAYGLVYSVDQPRTNMHLWMLVLACVIAICGTGLQIYLTWWDGNVSCCGLTDQAATTTKREENREFHPSANEATAEAEKLRP